MKYQTKHNLDDIREAYFTEQDIPDIDREAIDEIIKREKDAADGGSVWNEVWANKLKS